MRHLIILCSALSLLSSCREIPQGPYENYRITNDEAVPACQMRGVILRG